MNLLVRPEAEFDLAEAYAWYESRRPGLGIEFLSSVDACLATCGLDPIHVFGPKMDVSDIHILLKSRADSNRRGKEGPMSGEVIDLCYVCLSTLSLAKDPESIPVIVPLLNDPSDTVRQWSGIALKAIGESDVTLQKKIDEMKKRQNLEQESGQVRK